jgi:cytochrome c1
MAGNGDGEVKQARERNKLSRGRVGFCAAMMLQRFLVLLFIAKRNIYAGS